jgi:pimeloyl-ACP methyl ester carboxylesterase
MLNPVMVRTERHLTHPARRFDIRARAGTCDDSTGTVVLVHGGFVDGSGWQGVYEQLTKDCYAVSVVQNPTISHADHVVVTRRAIDAVSESVILVGHSYGGELSTLATVGEELTADVGDELYRVGDPICPFIAIPLVTEALSYIAVDREALRELLFEDGPLSDDVLSTFIARREALQRVAGIGLEVVGPRSSVPTMQTRNFAGFSSPPLGQIRIQTGLGGRSAFSSAGASRGVGQPRGPTPRRRRRWR